MAMQVNAEAVGLLGKFARRENIHVIHISTDFVFDGKSNRPYLETDKPNPINVYGVSKLKGEELLAQSGCRYAIMRVQWSYGKNGVNFISKILERARKGGVLKVVDDQTGSPTWTCDMARVICCLLHSQAGGLYHFADAGYASRFEVARFVVQKLGLSNALIPCSSSDFPVKARRPANSSFNTGKIQGVLDHKIRSWQDALSAYLAVTPLADISRIH
jgi:dTDP-4-dehydrorhamnose reductase